MIPSGHTTIIPTQTYSPPPQTANPNNAQTILNPNLPRDPTLPLVHDSPLKEDALKELAKQKIDEKLSKNPNATSAEKGYGTFEVLWEGNPKDLPQELLPEGIDKSQLNLGNSTMAIGKLKMYDENGNLVAEDYIHWGGWKNPTTGYAKNDVYYLSDPYAKYGSISVDRNGEIQNATMRISRNPSNAVASPGVTTERLHTDNNWARGSAFGTAGCWGTRGTMTQFYNAVNTIQSANGKRSVPIYVNKT